MLLNFIHQSAKSDQIISVMMLIIISLTEKLLCYK